MRVAQPTTWRHGVRGGHKVLVVVVVVLSAVAHRALVGHGRDGEAGAAGAALIIALVVAPSLRSLLSSEIMMGGGEEHEMSSLCRHRRGPWTVNISVMMLWIVGIVGINIKIHTCKNVPGL